MVRIHWKTLFLLLGILLLGSVLYLLTRRIHPLAEIIAVVTPLSMGYVCTSLPSDHSYWHLFYGGIFLTVLIAFFFIGIPLLMVFFGQVEVSMTAKPKPSTLSHSINLFPRLLQLLLYVLGGYIGKLRALASL